jgi:hypothetical protein
MPVALPALTRRIAALSSAAVLSLGAPARAQEAPTPRIEAPTLIGPCGFSVADLSFQGSPVEQASCLLRFVGPGGKVSSRPARLPRALKDRVGRPFDIAPDVLARGLAAEGCAGLIASLDRPVSRARDNDATAPLARYFTIHDTSTPFLKDKPFPRHMDDRPEINDVSPYAAPDKAVAHAFIKRTGEIEWGHDFSVPWRATKLESRVVGPPAKGLFLNIENVMPRRTDPRGPPGNDWIAPKPGLSANQYDRLALLYLYASARAGTWLIPAFHADLDEGVPDAHDDPQHFELKAFAAALERHVKAIRRAGAKPA